MPALYAHDRFGTLVTREARDDLKRIILKYNIEFRTGLQGSDPLFFHRVYHNNRVCRYGHWLHRVSALPFFRHAVTVIWNKGRDSREYAYLMGYICHFVLDSECHPYVNHMVQAIGVPHMEIESEFEKELLRSDFRDPIGYPLTDSMADDPATAEAMKPFYPSITQKELHTSLRWYRFAKGLFIAPSAPHQWLIDTILKICGKHTELSGLMHHRKNNPRCIRSNRELTARFDRSVDLAARLLEAFDESVRTGVPLDPRFDRNFISLG